MVEVPSIRERFRARAQHDHPALLFEEERYSWREHVQHSIERAALLLEMRPASPAPFHVGVLLDNVPEFSFLLGAAAYAGATLVGVNPTRRGAELARDIQHTDCGLLITEARYRDALAGLELGLREDQILEIESTAWRDAVARHRGASDPEVELDPTAPYLLIFTSGSTGQPKAAICSQARLAVIGGTVSETRGVGADAVSYQAMPMFHSNQLMAGWAPALHVGATMALRRKFSASGFLQDVRRFGITNFNYVGKPLTYILATPEQADDADNTLRIAFGNEAAEHDLQRFAKRFNCEVTDAYGSTEGSISIGRTPDTPPGALGVGIPGTVVLNKETGEECATAQFDETGRLLNADDAVGEIANVQTAQTFEGYYNNDEANAERTRNAIYWSGDLGYRDDKGFLYFAGRDFDWLRVDGENFAAAPIERILARHESVSLASVYGVPDEEVGDQLMAALILEPGASFDPTAFASFLEEQADLHAKAAPRYVRVADSLPSTETNKILKRILRQERWEASDPLWWRSGRELRYQRFTEEDAKALRERFAARGRLQALDA